MNSTQMLLKWIQFFSIVPEKSAYIVERFGKYHALLDPGLKFLIPIVDQIAYRHSLKEQLIPIEKQMAITKDNVSLHLDGCLFVQIVDPYKASYKVENPLVAIQLMAVTVLRSEIGKISLDKLFQERAELNRGITKAVNAASEEWGLNCLRCEILNIDPPEEIKKSMQYEAEAERLKRRELLISEGKKISEINLAEGRKISKILRAEGEAESINIIAAKEREALSLLNKAINEDKGKRVIDYILTNDYIENYDHTLKNSNVVVCPESNNSKEGSNSDLLTMAALMMMSNNQNQAVKKSEGKTYSAAQYQNEREKDTEQKDEYEDLIKKLKFYDDPLLYSSDDESKKKAAASANAQNNDQKAAEDAAAKA